MSDTHLSNESQVEIPSSARLLLAAEERQQALQINAEESQFDDERDLRQMFRRLVDPAIVRPNSKETVVGSLRTLSMLAENLLRDQDNAKFQRFKPTNALIKTNLVDVPGALEYAVAMGFRAEVQNFQPYYVHSPARRRDLRIGAAILKESLDLELQKQTRIADSKAREKTAAQSRLENVKKNYDDDRKQKRLRDQMEVERLKAKAASLIAKQSEQPATSTEPTTEPTVDSTQEDGISEQIQSRSAGSSGDEQ